MTRWTALTAGVLTSGALLYQFRHDIEQDTNQIRKKLYNTQNNLEATLPKKLKGTQNPPPKPLNPLNDRPQLPIPSVSQTEKYIRHRFIPTFKSSWNEHITSIAQSLINFDVNETAKSGYNNAKSFAEEKLVKKK